MFSAGADVEQFAALGKTEAGFDFIKVCFEPFKAVELSETPIIAAVNGAAFGFRNPLTQEAVYKTILVKRRRAFHRRVGEAVELIYADRLDGLYGLLIHHFTIAEERAKAN